MSLYGRTFFLVDADPFTRKWYEDNIGVSMSEPLPYPNDPVDNFRATFGLAKDRGGEQLDRFIIASLTGLYITSILYC